MGFFNDDDEAPAPQLTPISIPPIAANFPTVNFAEIFDEITNQQISFVRGVEGEEYLEMKSRYNKAKALLDEYPQSQWFKAGRQLQEKNVENARQAMEQAKAEQQRSSGLKPGEIKLSFKDLTNKPKLDAPIDFNNVDTTLPAVKDLPQFNMQYAANVAILSDALRNLNTTIETLTVTNPEVIQANLPLINSYKAANRQALNNNFDIRKNGLDLELAKRGLSGSSTAIGAIINLQKERNNAQVLNNLQEASLAQGLKESTIQNYLALGNQILNQGNLELNTFSRESGNQLIAREQDQRQEQLRQQQAENQVKLNLGKNQQLIDTELNRRQLALSERNNRNLPQLINSLISTGNQQALAGFGIETDANLNLQRNQLQKSALDMEKYRLDKQNENNLFTDLTSSVLGTVAGYGGNALGTKLFGAQFQPTYKK